MDFRPKRQYVRLEFSSEDEEKLIEYVRENPVLYNVKHPKYKMKQYRDRLWNEFGDTVNKLGFINIPSNVCKFIQTDYFVLQDRTVSKNGLT